MPSFVAKQRESPSDLTFDLEGGNLASVEKARCGASALHTWLSTFYEPFVFNFISIPAT